ncbi:hypothetical protein THAOC_36019, partial [Thalassiosira oceanica]
PRRRDARGVHGARVGGGRAGGDEGGGRAERTVGGGGGVAPGVGRGGGGPVSRGGGADDDGDGAPQRRPRPSRDGFPFKFGSRLNSMRDCVRRQAKVRGLDCVDFKSGRASGASQLCAEDVKG